MECPGRSGLHVFEDHFYPEIVNPDTGERYPKAPRANWCSPP